MRDTNDHILLSRLRAGEEGALAEVAHLYGSKIFQLAFRFLKNKEDAEEVTQDVLYNVYRNIGAFRGDAALSSWIYRVAFNAAMSRLRAGHYQRLQGQEAHSPSNGDDSGGQPRADVADWGQMADEHVLRSQLRRRVLREVLALPAIYRAPVVLRDIKGMSTEEASAVLQVKDQTLKSRLHRGRLILRKQLADFADGLALHRPIYGT